MAGKTLYDKLWDSHLVKQRDDGSALLYIDRHLLHEVTSPQAFEGLRLAGREPWRIDANLATADHNVPTTINERAGGIAAISDNVARIQVQTLDDNCEAFGITEYKMNDAGQGIVHVIGPEQGATLPGMTVVCGDSHTATHGALGALAHGIGTSEVEHVLASQCLVAKKMKNMLVRVDGQLGLGVTAKDVVLAVIARLGTAGGTGYAIEFGGEVFRNMSMEGRMTLCNMAIEAGARVGMIAPDETTFAYLEGRERAPQGEDWDAAVARWRELPSDPDASFDKEVTVDAAAIRSMITYGVSPDAAAPVTGNAPAPANDSEREAAEYMRFAADRPFAEAKVDRVFIGSCTNSRLSDLREAAEVMRGRQVADGVVALIVPGSEVIRQQAEAEGLDAIFTDAGAEWRLPGCSMCIAMNGDQGAPGELVVSTSNRNFVGRQGKGVRTVLAGPATAAACAIAGHIADPSQYISTEARDAA